MDIRRILIGVDFSPTSERALEYAIDLAKRFGAAVELLHVYQIPAFAFPESIVPAPPETVERMVDEIKRHLDAWAGKARAVGLEASSDLLPGSPAVELCARAAEGKCDLIVVGTHGRTGIRHALLGSVAEKVVRRATVPVLTVTSVESPDEED
jgi:nucleotide-binding universal stress UspA family protein